MIVETNNANLSGNNHLIANKDKDKDKHLQNRRRRRILKADIILTHGRL